MVCSAIIQPDQGSNIDLVISFIFTVEIVAKVCSESNGYKLQFTMQTEDCL